MRDVMVDIETLGSTAGSVILSIGAVGFDAEHGELGHRFHEVISLTSALGAGATVSVETIEWWSKQTPAAQAVIFRALSPDAPPMPTVFEQFAAFLAAECDAKRLRLWGNGSDFDNVLLIAGFDQVGQAPPWRFYNHRCFRTLKNLFPGHEPKREGLHHDALDDAVHQARWAIAIEAGRRRLTDARPARPDTGLSWTAGYDPRPRALVSAGGSAA